MSSISYDCTNDASSPSKRSMLCKNSVILLRPKSKVSRRFGEEPIERHHLTARVRLAGAMMGRQLGQPATEPVRLGNNKFPPEEFEKLVADMLQRFGDDTPGESAGSTAGDSDSAPGPGRFEPRPWAKFDGDMGSRPEAVPGSSTRLDWPARQMSVVVESGMMIVANRFQVVDNEPMLT